MLQALPLPDGIVFRGLARADLPAPFAALTEWHPDIDSASQRLAARYAGDFHEVWSAPWHEQLFALPPSLVSRLH
ncbi:hypothetical protein POL58_46740 [Nannocystis sp. ncelm1]|uniref:Uncharacterized protein n=2 Tax=Nannocystis radixulma TaxID=2995305 RepID=A0ABT5BMD4_9BACT|nr:hypothetical protein [Nannocystis radixulma]